MTDIEARLACASSFILQSPPGEVNDVFNDVRALVDDDEALEQGILPALDKYNTQQLITADLPEGKQQLLICETGRVPSEESRFIDPTTSTSYTFDHLRLTASDPVPVYVDDECEAFRAELEKAAGAYEKEHFAGTTNAGEAAKNGVSKVFTVEQTTLNRAPKAKAQQVQTEAAKEGIETPASPVEKEESKEDPSKELDQPEKQIISESVPRVVKSPDNAKDDDGPTTPGTQINESETVIMNTSEGVHVPFKGEGQSPGCSEAKPKQETEVIAKLVEDFEEGKKDEPHAVAEDVAEGQDVEMTSASTAATPAAQDPDDEDAQMVSEAAGDAQRPVQAEEEQELEATPGPLAKKFALYFVGNKYNPSNYWTGRWRSSYKLDLSSSPASLSGSIQLHVHFFEQGNVQLTTSHTPTLSLPESVTQDASPAEVAKSVLKTIKKAEEEYQMELNEAYREMSDKTFRNLRRALPITRQKMDWAKVANYKLGRNLGAGQ